MAAPIPDTPELQAELANRWQRILDMSAFDSADESGAWNLVYSLHGIQDSCRALLEQRLPRLVSADSTDLQAALSEVGEELRHLTYHLRDARYFGYIADGRGEPQSADGG